MISKFTKLHIVFGALATLVAMALADCPTVCLDVSQGSRYFGRFPPIQTSTNVVDFYRYQHYSFNGDDIVPLLIDQSLLMIHEYNNNDNDDNDICELSIVMVHDSKDDSTGGQIHMWLTGNHELPLVQDGPGDGSKSDRYLYIPKKDQTELFWEWGWQTGPSKKFRTDGMADSWDFAEHACLEVSAKFILGIDAWRFVPGPVDTDSGRVDPNDYLFLDKDETLKICKVDDCETRPWGDQE